MYVTFGPGQALLHWEPDTGISPLYRSEAPHDGFEHIDDIDLSIGIYKDQFEETTNKHRYYKIGNELLEMYQDPDPISKEIIRRTEWFLKTKRYSGANNGYLLIARTDGKRCPVCYDEINHKIKLTACTVCFGTTFEKPFYEPYEIYFAIGGPKNLITPSPDFLTTKGYDEMIWTINKPLIKPNDILAYDGIRYRVVGPVRYSRKNMYIVSQTVALQAIENNKAIYRIPIPGEVT